MRTISQDIGELVAELSRIQDSAFAIQARARDLSSRLTTLRAALATVNAAAKTNTQEEDQDGA